MHAAQKTLWKMKNRSFNEVIFILKELAHLNESQSKYRVALASHYVAEDSFLLDLMPVLIELIRLQSDEIRKNLKTLLLQTSQQIGIKSRAGWNFSLRNVANIGSIQNVKTKGSMWTKTYKTAFITKTKEKRYKIKNIFSKLNLKKNQKHVKSITNTD